MRNPDVAENKIAAVLFCLALLFHAWGAHVGWDSLNLPGCEFRQAQTALTAEFIQREDNFSLAYPTPVLGKPWSIPMEFPLYQWTVVELSNLSGMPLTQAGRTVSLLCFYLAMPALYTLLARVGLSFAFRLVALTVVLTCPLYIFYARAFLIETMAWMFGTWFLLGYVYAVEKRRPVWLALAAFAGAGAGLVKVTTLLFFLIPAFTWTLVWFWQDFRRSVGRDRFRLLVTRTVWCGLAVVVPFGAAIWWVKYSDLIKARSIAGAFLQSSNVSDYNFGVGVRWSADLWQQHWTILFQELTSVPVLIFCVTAALLFGRRWWTLILTLVFFFFIIQVACPVLYAWHEYYYVANAMMLMLALGLTLCGLLESRLPRWLAWTLIIGVIGGQAALYLRHDYPGQKLHSEGGSPVTQALKAVTAADDVVIIAGDDWSSITPYFAQRRALMIRRNLETTWEIIHPAFRALANEPVTALVLQGKQKQNQTFLDLTSQYFQIDRRPVAFWPGTDAAIYLHEQMRSDPAILNSLKEVPGIRLAPGMEAETSFLAHREVEMTTVLPRYRTRFSRMHPLPWKYYAAFGVQPFTVEGSNYLLANAESKFWFKAPAGQRTISAEILMLPEAYADSVKWGDRSDGVEVAINAKQNGGVAKQILSRLINPRDNPADRGIQKMTLSFTLLSDADVELDILPGPTGNGARDWVVVGDVRID